MAADVSVRQVVSFAPTSASGRTNEAFAANDARAIERLFEWTDGAQRPSLEI